MRFRDIMDSDRIHLNDFAVAELADDASRNLLSIFKDMAGAEALTRALVAERTENSDKAEFWAQVYLRCRARFDAAAG